MMRPIVERTRIPKSLGGITGDTPASALQNNPGNEAAPAQASDQSYAREHGTQDPQWRVRVRLPGRVGGGLVVRITGPDCHRRGGKRTRSWTLPMRSFTHLPTTLHGYGRGAATMDQGADKIPDSRFC